MDSRVDEIRNMVSLTEHTVDNVHSLDYPGTFPGYDDTWSQRKFEENFKIGIISMTPSEIEFEMKGIDCSLANAFRRILMAEVPAMAIDHIEMYNTSIIPDEVLALRLGLIPIRADARMFEYRTEGEETGTDIDTLEFEMKVRCTKNPAAPKDCTDPNEKYLNHKVYSRQIKWKPIGTQAETFKDAQIGPVDGDILIASLQVGQEIHCKMQAVKGQGADHVKFQPVCPATYRLMPSIELLKPIEGEQAQRLQKCFAKGVIELHERNGRTVAVVANPRLDTCSREVFRHNDLKDLVKLNRIRDHFIFTVESAGQMPARMLVQEGIKILISKCQNMKQKYEQHLEEEEAQRQQQEEEEDQ